MDAFPRTGVCSFSSEVHYSLRRQCTDQQVALGWRRPRRGGERKIREISGDIPYSEKTSGWWYAVGLHFFYRDVGRSKGNQPSQV